MNHSSLRLAFQTWKTKHRCRFLIRYGLAASPKHLPGLFFLQLVDEGKISLSDPLSKYFPDFPNGKNITIKELADMTSGIYNYTEDLMFSDFSGSMKKNYTHQELIDIALKHPPYFKPGSTFHYSNTNFILLGMIIEKITGDSLPNEIQKRILTPLGMTDTSFPGRHNICKSACSWL